MTTIPDRIESLLARDYYGDEVTREHCRRLASFAGRMYHGHDVARMAVEAAEHMVELSERLRRAGKVETLKRELDRKVT